ncbi:MAG: DUF4826 family protein [Xanthomonadales bacterium]|jgi:hypothetical protein|nr:DUF4826 family protein [Xanthomonadales bacterium]MDH3923118.1 DUF4826 family protein [Xanthomonadales bacterium]MDH3941855.1 DUF4826 family protein [Xanthomonadales bacterium]MDH4001735.1 DUF4826 family protein [Xanthomonadales bacterium]
MTKTEPWFKPMLDQLVAKMINIGAISGVAVDANPAWGVEDQLLIAKVWDSSNKSQFIWAITGDLAVTDHIPGNLAVTPRDAARHFSYKWQMDADRLAEMANADSQVANTRANIEAQSKKIIQLAESLYAMTEQEEAWK